jgi:hypothetical protein
VDIKPSNSRLLVMNQAAFTSAKSAIHILGSGGAADCVVIGAYDETNKRLFLMHATRMTDIGDVVARIARVLKLPKVHISSEAVAKQKNSELLADIRAAFKESSGMAIVNEFDTGNLAIDATTGEVVSVINKGDFGGMHSGNEPKPKLTQKYTVVEIPPRKGGPKGSEEAKGEGKQETKQSDLRKELGLMLEYYDSELEELAKQTQVVETASSATVRPRRGSFGSLKL